jgi:hypothetical protein
MEYLLKHKNINAALLEIQDSNIIDIHEIYEKEHLPIRQVNEKAQNLYLLNNWLENRGIPRSRENYTDLLQYYKLESLKSLTLLCYGLNLTDHWWLCRSRDDKKWEAVNFFQNDFSEKTGALLFTLQDKQIYANPDFSSNGHLVKMWKIAGGKRVLYKAGSGDIQQEPYNECAASAIADKLNIRHVPYHLSVIGESTYSGCECMVDEDTEFIDAFKVFLHNTEEKTSAYNDFIKICKKQGLDKAGEEVDRMIVFDYLIRNTDRNMGNYGIIRNSQTLKWLYTAPLFDHGASFWSDTQNIDHITNDRKSGCRSFEGTNEKNIRLITHHEWYNRDGIKDLSDLAVGIFQKNTNMEKERIARIVACLAERSITLARELPKRPGMAKHHKPERMDRDGR